MEPIKIIARKPREENLEYIVADRGDDLGPFTMRWVCATISEHSLRHGEWFWGHYFNTLDEAMVYFNKQRGALND